MRVQSCRSLASHTVSVFLAFMLIFAQLPELFAGQNSSAAQTGSGLKIVVFEGQEAVHNVRQLMPQQVVVDVTDEADRPVAGAVIGFLLPDSGPGGTFSNGINALSVVTDTEGRAVAPFTPNATVGPFSIIVTASFQGLSATTQISQSNITDQQTAAAEEPAAGAGPGMSRSTMALIAAAVVAGALVLAVSMGGDSGGGETGTPPPSGQPTIRIGLGGTTTVGAPGGWQSSVKKETALPKWRP